MKAIVYTEYGSPDVLRLCERERPVAADDEVLIRVRAAEVTKGDTELRSFHFPVKWFVLPLRIAWGLFRPRRQVLGGYFAGVVDAVGSKVDRFALGDEVYGASGMRMGTHGQFVALPQRYCIAAKPRNLSFDEAAAVPLGGLNALHFMRLAAVQPGERVLINGAGGSIGTFGVQIAKSMGAHVTSVDAPHKAALLKRIGADRFIDYTQEDFAQDGLRYDVVFDMVAGSSYEKCLSVLGEHGRYVCGNPTLAKLVRSQLTSRFTSKRASCAFARETVQELCDLTDMLEAGTIHAPVDQVFPLERAAEAHTRVEAEARQGAVILSLA